MRCANNIVYLLKSIYPRNYWYEIKEFGQRCIPVCLSSIFHDLFQQYIKPVFTVPHGPIYQSSRLVFIMILSTCVSKPVFSFIQYPSINTPKP